MSLDLDSVGTTTPPHALTYDWKTTVLYSLGVGATRDELDLLYEGRGPKVLPTFALIAAYAPVGELFGKARCDMTRLVHSAQKLRVHRPIPASGTLETVGRVKGIYDMKKLAQVVFETTTTLGGELREGGQRAGGDDLTASVVVGGGEVELLEAAEHRGLVSSDHGAHAGLLERCGLGHRAAADAHQAHTVLLGEDAGGDERRDFAHGVAGDAVRPVTGGDERAPGEQARGDDEGLGDLGVADAVGIPLGSGGDEVDLGERGVLLEQLAGAFGVEPRGEEPGGLRTLAREDGDDHGFHPCKFESDVLSVGAQQSADRLSVSYRISRGASGAGGSPRRRSSPGSAPSGG